MRAHPLAAAYYSASRAGCLRWFASRLPALVRLQGNGYVRDMAVDSTVDIDARFRANLARVQALVSGHRQLARGAFGRGDAIRPEVRDELLRAAVVLMHAALEDLLRSIESVRLPVARAEDYKHLHLFSPDGDPYKGEGRFSLIQLADWRGRSVDEVFAASIEAYLERSNYNNVNDVVGALHRSGLGDAWDAQYGGGLTALMSRRHWIAHRADRNYAGLGHSANAIEVATVDSWLKLVQNFGGRVIAALAGAST